MAVRLPDGGRQGHVRSISGLLCWLSFILTTVAVNNAFSRRKAVLTLIDGGYWLAALVAMGAIIGGLGPLSLPLPPKV